MAYSQSVLPPLFAKWMNALLGAPIPPERASTCERCAMCAPADASVPSLGTFFSPVTKCCTFLPELSNFLVGAILADADPDAVEGRNTVEQRIRDGVEVTPLGLGRSREFAARYESSPEVFGQSSSMECPHHLPDGRCGVWRHRDSTCATWFCKHDRGRTGKDFWHRVHALLIGIEMALSRHAVLSIGLPQAALERLFPPGTGLLPGLVREPIDAKTNPKGYRAVWGDYVDREREFYGRAAEIVNALEFPDVMALGGTEIELRARLMRAAFEKLVSDDVPARPRQRRLHVLQMSADAAYVETYSKLDPLTVPNALFRALHCFDGRPTDDALRAIEADYGLRVPPSVVRKLVDFGLLGEET